MSEIQKSHTRWSVSLKSGESKTTRDGTKFTNVGRSTVNLLVEVPVQSESNTQTTK